MLNLIGKRQVDDKKATKKLRMAVTKDSVVQLLNKKPMTNDASVSITKTMNTTLIEKELRTKLNILSVCSTITV